MASKFNKIVVWVFVSLVLFCAALGYGQILDFCSDQGAKFAEAQHKRKMDKLKKSKGADFVVSSRTVPKDKWTSDPGKWTSNRGEWVPAPEPDGSCSHMRCKSSDGDFVCTARCPDGYVYLWQPIARALYDTPVPHKEGKKK